MQSRFASASAVVFALTLTPTLVACDPPVEEVPDCTDNVVLVTDTLAGFMASIACTWPLIAEDRSTASSTDDTLTHGTVYDVAITQDGATVPADDGAIAFSLDAATLVDEEAEVSATLRALPRTLRIGWQKADATPVIVFSDTDTAANYQLAEVEPPSPLLSTGAYTDLGPLAATFPGTIDFATALDVEFQEVTPLIATCGPMSVTIATSGVVSLDLAGTALTLPYRPRGTRIQQFDSNGTERTTLTWAEDDNRRVSVEVTRPTGSDGAFTLVTASAQVPEGGNGVIAEYTHRPDQSACN